MAKAEKQVQQDPQESKVERIVPPLTPQRAALAEAVRAHYVVTVADAKHPEDFLRPEFWSLIAKDLRPGFRVDIIDDGLTFFGEYVVVAAERTWAKVHTLRTSALVPVDEVEISPDFTIEYKGPHLRYCVVRKSDSSIVHEGADSRVDANTWLLGYARVVGAKLAA